MNTIRGEIQSVSQKTTSTGKDKFGIRVLGKWYTGWGKTSYKRGDLVEINYTTTGFGNDIKAIRSPNPILPAPQGMETPKLKMHVEAGAGLPSPKDISIVRQSCISSACMVFQGREVPMVTITAYAQFFLDWIEKRDGEYERH